MKYRDIEIEWMKDILREKEEEIRKLKLKNSKLTVKYAKALEDKVLETNKLCTERNNAYKLINKLKEEIERLRTQE